MVDAAIRSVLAQDHPSFELIVMDDASDAETAGVLRAHADADARVRLFRSEASIGQVILINRAHTHARGRYIGWIDSDDLILPDCLSATAAVLDANPDVGCVYTDQLVIDLDNKPIGYGQRANIPYSPERLLVDFMAFHFRLYRRELFDRVGGLDEELPAAGDYDFVLKLSEVTRFERLARPLYLYRQHDETISSARRIDQIEGSAEAVRRAMRRRGMDATHRLDVELISRFRVVPLDGGVPRTSENDPTSRPGRARS